MSGTVYLHCKGYKYKCQIHREKGRIFFKTPYALKDEIKSMQGARWDPDAKMWSATDSQRNNFQLEYLLGNDPYKNYDKELMPYHSTRPLYQHQIEMIQYIITYKRVLLACEMGLGKTLAMIESLENVKPKKAWYVGPRAGVRAVTRELEKWNSEVSPEMMTYEGLNKIMLNWQGGEAPDFVIFDECSKIKNPTAKRSQSAKHLADSVRKEHDGYIVGMSGTPAPRAPTDWWHQVECLCPGFIREGDVAKFKKGLCKIEFRDSITGGEYPHMVTWWNDENKCAICGEYHLATQDDSLSEMEEMIKYDHEFKKSINEVDRLHKRLKGIVLVQFKRDCLGLPEKVYDEIKIKPSLSMVRGAQIIKKTSDRAITALSLLRELSDGFQYVQVEIGTSTCPNCNGSKEMVVLDPVDKNLQGPTDSEIEYEEKIMPCDKCNGTGTVPLYEQQSKEIGTPKDEALIEILDEHDDIGRLVVWGGFTATIDRLIGVIHKFGWITLRVDGRGYSGVAPTGEILDANELLDAMDASHPDYQILRDKFPKVCFVGQPGAGGMALTLHASPTAVFYSNDFNGESRMQAEDRIHRAGMTGGAKIIDLICLATDKLVLENLKQKKSLQSITLGELDVL